MKYVFYIAILFSSLSAYAVTSAHLYVASEAVNSKAELNKQCKILKEFYKTSRCNAFDFKKILNKDKAPLILDPKVKLNIFLWEDFGGDYNLYVSNTRAEQEFGATQAEWKISRSDKEWKQALLALLRNTSQYFDEEKNIKEMVLQLGLQTVGSKKIKTLDDNYYKLPQNQKINFNEAYELYMTEGPIQKNYTMAFLELGLVLGGGIKWYYGNLSFNSVDFDFNNKDFNASSILNPNRIRFDNNDPVINKKHINAGLAYYLAFRTNGFSRGESVLAAFLASSFWEYMVEYREVVSINDEILTPLGGYVLGEVAYQMGKKFLNVYGGPVAEAMQKIFGGPNSFSKWLSQYARKSPSEFQKYGFDPKAFSYFTAGILGYSKEANGLNGKDQGKMWFVESEIIEIPLAAGNITKIIDTGFTKLLAEGTFDNKGTDYFKMIAKTAFTGIYNQNIKISSENQVTGYNILIVPGSGLDVEVEKNLKAGSTRDYNEMIVNVNVIGSAIRIEGFNKDYRFKVELEGYGDFAMVKSYALESYRSTNDVSGMASVTRDQGYYYAGGLTGAVGVSGSYKLLEVGARYTTDTFTGINSRPRDQEQVTFAPDLRDYRQRQEIFAKIKMKKDLIFKCGLEWVTRGGRLDSYQIASDGPTMRQSCAMSYSFW